MQYVMYAPTLFYHPFNQYITYINILKMYKNANTFGFHSKNVCNISGFASLVQCTWFATTGWYWNLYVIFIHTLDTDFMYWRWQMIHQHEACAMYFHIQYSATTYMWHSYHSNHNTLSLKKIVHTVKPLPGKLCYMSLRG